MKGMPPFQAVTFGGREMSIGSSGGFLFFLVLLGFLSIQWFCSRNCWVRAIQGQILGVSKNG